MQTRDQAKVESIARSYEGLWHDQQRGAPIADVEEEVRAIITRSAEQQYDSSQIRRGIALGRKRCES
jgi:hypothetical protein